MGKELLTLRDVSKYYTSGKSVVMGLNKINLSFRAGEFVAITGESGSGKSTLARIMAGILPYENGEMFLAGRPTSHYDGSDWEHYRSDSISFISQSYDILPGCTVERNVVSALRLTGMDKADADIRAKEILQEVELWSLRSRRAAKLSSGQKQRLSIARALAKPAPILIADEPTGNLDPENSAKVISLLSAAAKERLVIIITHEFDEVADHATRHITMQDSVVSADVVLRADAGAQFEEKAPAKRTKKIPRGLSFYTAHLQISSRPVWSTIMLAFFSLTAFAVFAFLGTFIVNLDDTSTRIYDNSAFRNGDMERIVVVRADGEQLTDEDIQNMLTVPHAKSIERYGIISDVNYFYREGVDYFSHYSAEGGDMLTDATHVGKQVTPEGYSLFMETIPVLAEGEKFLTGGRLPENMHEVVAGDESLLGQTIPVYIQDTKNWGRTSYMTFYMTVVGTTDYGAHLYFDEQYGRSHGSSWMHPGFFAIPSYTEELDGKFLSSENLYEQLRYYSDNPEYLYFMNSGWLKDILSNVTPDGMVFHCYGEGSAEITLALSGTHSYGNGLVMVVSPEAFEMLVDPGYYTQMCLSIENYAYTDEVIDTLRAMGYGALSPYQMGSNQQDPELAAERMQTLKICLLALIAVVLLQIVVLRAMFSMETEEYRLLANLGLRCKNAKRSVLWQVVAFSLGGEVLAVVAIALCGAIKVERIVSILRYLPAPYMLLTWGIHFAAGLLTTAWIAHSLRRQVYPITGAGMDLIMDEEVEA